MRLGYHTLSHMQQREGPERELLACRAVRQALLPSVLALLLAGCPTPVPPVDSGMIEDAGVDAGAPDAGRPPRDAGIPDAGFTAAPITSWCSLRAVAECGRDLRCGRLTQGRFAGCVLNRTRTSACDQIAIQRGVSELRTQYLEAEAVRCLNGFAEGSCTEESLACGNIFTGLAPPDAGCLTTNDCNASGFCSTYDGRCPHTCQRWAAEDQPCDGFTRRCDPVNGSCDLNDAGLAVCFPRKNEGDACQRYDSCGDDSSCVDRTCITRLAAPGQPCATRSGFPFCTPEYFCRQDPPVNGVRPPGTCERKSGLNGTCTGPGTCLPSLRCSTFITTGTCLRKGALREPCINYDDCEDTLYCDSKTQRCEGLPDAGGNCSFELTGYRCAPGFACAFSGTSDDKCVVVKAAGSECGYTAECLSNECEYTTLPDGGFGGTCIVSCSQRADGGL